MQPNTPQSPIEDKKTQEELIEFVTSEKTLRAAVDGSMEKRAKLMQPNDMAEMKQCKRCSLMTYTIKYKDMCVPCSDKVTNRFKRKPVKIVRRKHE